MDLEPIIDAEEHDNFFEEEADSPSARESQSRASFDEGEEDMDGMSEELSSKLLFHIQELGGHKIVNGVEIYLLSEHSESGLRDLLTLVKNEIVHAPFAKECLLRWNIVKMNLIPLFLIQRENKPIVFKTLALINKLSEPLVESELVDFPQREALDEGLFSCVQTLVERKIVAALVEELCECVKVPAESRNEYESGAIDLIVSIVRNIVAFRHFITAKASREADEQLFSRIVTLFAEGNGVFDALVYLTQKLSSVQRPLIDVFIAIFAGIFRRVQLEQILGELFEEQQLQKLRQIEKLRTEERMQTVVADRHSRFGAAFTVRGKFNQCKTFSNLKQVLRLKPQDLFEKAIKNKILKPRTGRKRVESLAEPRRIVDKHVKTPLKVFFLDLLEHSFVSLLMQAIGLFAQETVRPAQDSRRFSDFVELVAFGLQAALILKPKGVKCHWLGHCLQFGVLDLLFVAWRKETHKHKSEISANCVQEHVRIFFLVLGCVKMLLGSAVAQENRNGVLLQKMIFSHDLAPLLKLSAAHLPVLEWKSVMAAADLFFTMLGDFARDKIYTIRAPEELPDEEEELLGQNSRGAALREKKMNYLTELARFIDYEWVKAHIDLLQEGKIDALTPQLLSVIVNLLRRVDEDIGANWIFFSADILATMDAFYTNNSPLVKAQPKCAEVKKQLLKIFDFFKKTFEKNSLLAVECLFTIRSFEAKEQVLSNYQADGARAPDEGLVSSEAVMTALLREKNNTRFICGRNADMLEDYWLIGNFRTEHVKDFDLLHSLYLAQVSFSSSANQLCSKVISWKLDGSEDAQHKATEIFLRNWFYSSQKSAKLRIKAFKKAVEDNRETETEAFFVFLLKHIESLKFFRTNNTTISIYFPIIFANATEAEFVGDNSQILDTLGLLPPDEKLLQKFWRIPSFLSTEKLLEDVEVAIREWEVFKIEGEGKASKVEKRSLSKPERKLKKKKDADISEGDELLDLAGVKNMSKNSSDEEENNLFCLMTGEDDNDQKVPPKKKLSKLRDSLT